MIHINVVVPCARPHKVPQVVAQFRALTHARKSLFVVASGPAWDGAPVPLFLHRGTEMFLQGPPGKGPALNLALCDLAGHYVVVRDDDDIYTPNSLAEFAGLLPRFDFVAQRRHWAQLADGRLLLYSRDNHSKPADTCKIWGGNLGFKVGPNTPRFNDARVTQCQDWVQGMLTHGASGWLKSPQGACIARGEPDHLWRATDAMVAYTFGDGYEFPARDLTTLVDSPARPINGAPVPAPDVRTAHLSQIRAMACAS